MSNFMANGLKRFQLLKRATLCATLCAAVAVALAGLCGSCAQAQPELSGPPTEIKNIWKIQTVAQGVARPWGLTWLPDGTAIVTAKEGTLHKVVGDQFIEIPTEGLPQVFSGGQGALMDIALHPNFAQNKWIYLTLSTGSNRANRTILVRGTFDGEKLAGIETLFKVNLEKGGGAHFGSRLAWLPDGTLLMSIGDGGNPPTRIGDRLAREQAQNTGAHQGKILRLTQDGKPAPNNPFAKQDGALPELWSIGHRNIQGLTRDAATGRVWATEHGPRGGDELNLIEGGKNHGWPIVSLGRDYRTGEPVGVTTQEGFVDPKIAWTPSPGASGLMVYSGAHFPQWKGSILSGGLASQDIRRVSLDDKGNVTGQERMRIGRRVRDVRQGPDGHIYALTDEQDGELLRILPSN